MKWKKAAILTIVFNAVILIGAGHGIAPLGLIEVMMLFSSEWWHGLFAEGFSLAVKEPLFIPPLISLAGQLIIGIGIWIGSRGGNGYRGWLMAGLLFLWIGFVGLLIGVDTWIFSLICGIPFIIYTGILLYRVWGPQTPLEEEEIAP